VRRCEIDRLDPTRTWWVAAVVSPRRDWAGAPGCRRGARFMVEGGLRPSRDAFEPFDSRASCLGWIMSHRAALSRAFPGAPVRAVALDRWLLGLD
jgi:hypothetical protein